MAATSYEPVITTTPVTPPASSVAPTEQVAIAFSQPLSSDLPPTVYAAQSLPPSLDLPPTVYAASSDQPPTQLAGALSPNLLPSTVLEPSTGGNLEDTFLDESISAQESALLPAKQQSFGYLMVIDSGPSSLRAGKRFDLMQKTTIGRETANIIQLPYSFISAEHTLLTFYDNSWHIADAGSKTGTYLNNQQLTDQSLPAKFGDFVQVGFIKFRLMK